MSEIFEPEYVFEVALCETCSGNDYCDRVNCNVHDACKKIFNDMASRGIIAYANGTANPKTYIINYILENFCEVSCPGEKYCDECLDGDDCKLRERFDRACGYILERYPDNCFSYGYKNEIEYYTHDVNDKNWIPPEYRQFFKQMPEVETYDPPICVRPEASTNEPTIKDSGDRTEFDTGAVRDMRKGKGRCDLMPLDVVYTWLNRALDDSYETVQAIDNYINEDGGGYRNVLYLFRAIDNFVWNESAYADDIAWKDGDELKRKSRYCAILDVAVQFEEGAAKYGENNWRKGIPVKLYLDSALRHYFKYLRGDCDERHDRAFIWNMMCAIWTSWHKPELDVGNR